MTINVRVHSQTGYATGAPTNTEVDAELESSGSSIALAVRGASASGSGTSPGPRKASVLIRAADARDRPRRQPAGR